jgi:hypothetical protein
MMKKLILIIALIVTVSYAQEGFKSPALKTKAGSGTWLLSATAIDTSETFPMYSYMTWKGNINDIAPPYYNDSLAYTVELYTSSIKTTFDSSFTLQQVLFNSATAFDGDSAVAFHGGWTRPIAVRATPERFGAIIVKGQTGATQMVDGLSGVMYICGWSDQPGAILSK